MCDTPIARITGFVSSLRTYLVGHNIILRTYHMILYFCFTAEIVWCAGLHSLCCSPACLLRSALHGQTTFFLYCKAYLRLVVCDHSSSSRPRLCEASARTLVVLDVEGCKYQFSAKNTNIYIHYVVRAEGKMHRIDVLTTQK